MTTLEALEKLDELFSDPEHFCQGNYAEAHHGVAVSPVDPQAVRFCIHGGIYYILPGDTNSAHSIRADMCNKLGTMGYKKYNTSSLISLNDDGTKEEAYTRIKGLIKEAIDKCRNT